MQPLSLFALKPPVPCVLGTKYTLTCAGCGNAEIAAAICPPGTSSEDLILAGHNRKPGDPALHLNPSAVMFLKDAPAHQQVGVFCMGCGQKLREGIEVAGVHLRPIKG